MTFMDLYFPAGMAIERDEIQDALEHRFEGLIAVVGAGIGADGASLDLEIAPDFAIEDALHAVVEALADLGVPESTLISISDPCTKLSVAEWRPRIARYRRGWGTGGSWFDT